MYIIHYIRIIYLKQFCKYIMKKILNTHSHTCIYKILPDELHYRIGNSILLVKNLFFYIICARLMHVYFNIIYAIYFACPLQSRIFR